MNITNHPNKEFITHDLFGLREITSDKNVQTDFDFAS